MVDELTPDRRASARQELRRLSEAFDQLSDQTRAVIWLRRIEGLSQRDAAKRLGIKELTLAGYLSKGLRKLAGHILTEEGPGSAAGEHPADEDEMEHGKRL